MTQRVYLETSVISYLTALPSRDLLVAGHQQVTREWWDKRTRFGLYVSEAVVQEVSRGDAGAAARRIEALQGLAILASAPQALELARSFLATATIPGKAAIDALHVALAAVHGMDFLLTWNCTHIANAALRPQLEELCWRAGFRPPIICTPLELMEENES
ncbi:MAG TPA: type II toxin-antitoxin system VapC family toxin [Dehalococcoidia bacterium]|nr:type II toxin-antitoxin system VapC family toxin [Dehalococcoidia bacterium]